MLQIEHRDSEIRVLVKMLHRPAGEAEHDGRSLPAAQEDLAANGVSMPVQSVNMPLHSAQSLDEALAASVHGQQVNGPFIPDALYLNMYRVSGTKRKHLLRHATPYCTQARFITHGRLHNELKIPGPDQVI